MKTYLLLGLLVSFSAHAGQQDLGCYAYGHSFGTGEDDCDGRVCQSDGTWNGVVKSGLCEYSEDEDAAKDPGSRDPASVKKPKKSKHQSKGKKKKGQKH